MFYLQIFMRMDLPSVIISDNGKGFDNQLNADIVDLLGIQHRLITPYHPQLSVTLGHSKSIICFWSLQLSQVHAGGGVVRTVRLRLIELKLEEEALNQTIDV